MGYTPHVLVVGGGVVGTGIARDFAIRGLDVTLVERGTLAAGATGRSLGLLDSGARSASHGLARRASRENQILRRIASGCIESTGGLLLADGDEFEEIRETIEERSIPHELLDGDSARNTESGLSSQVERALSVPDAVVDQSGLAVENARSAREYGATIRTQTTVTDITIDGGTLDTVTVEHDPTQTASQRPGDEQAKADGDKPGAPGASSNSDNQGSGRNGAKTEEFDPDYVVNAAGAWAGEVASLAGLDVDLALTTGTTVHLADAPVSTVVTRCIDGFRGPTITPLGERGVVGTAHEDVSHPSEPVVSTAGTGQLLDQLSETVPDVEEARQLRWDWGLYAGQPNGEGEHEYVTVDHGDRDDCWGMTTVAGGSVTTHRYLAEQVVDDVCSKFGIRRECQTDERPLPGSTEQTVQDETEFTTRSPVICECESVTRGDVREALDDETGMDMNLDTIRIRTGATMGECQGGKCAHRLACELLRDDGTGVDQTLDSFLESHWQGQRYALSGKQLERAMRTYVFQVDTLQLTAPDATFVSSKAEDVDEALEEDRTVTTDTVSLSAFDDGTVRQSRGRPTCGERPP